MSTVSCGEDDSRSWAGRLFLLCLALASIHMVSNACQPGGSRIQCNACEQEASLPCWWCEGQPAPAQGAAIESVASFAN